MGNKFQSNVDSQRGQDICDGKSDQNPGFEVFDTLLFSGFSGWKNKMKVKMDAKIFPFSQNDIGRIIVSDVLRIILRRT